MRLKSLKLIGPVLNEIRLMKKINFSFLLLTLLFSSSCSTVVRQVAKSAANNYDDQLDRQINSLKLEDVQGKVMTFGELFSGKIVYLYVWKSPILLPPDDQDEAYRNLKSRFVRYDDVVFLNLYTGDKAADWKLTAAREQKDVGVYRLAADAANTEFRELYGISTSPQIIGKNGHILGFKGPKPADRIVVDYALEQARQGINATESSRKLIRSANAQRGSEIEHLRTWYQAHFGEELLPAEQIRLNNISLH